MQPISTFIFDLDGTLVDSVPDLAHALNATLHDMGLPTYPETTIRHWVGNGARMLVERGLSGSTSISHGQSSAQVDAALDKFLAHYRVLVCQYSTLYKGVFDTLATLKCKQYNLALVTNKPEEFIPPILNAYSLNDMFLVTVGGDSLPEKKPSPLPLLHVSDTLNVMPETCIMVGDSKNDIQAAKAANMRCVGLTYGYNYGEDIAIHEPDWVFDCFTQLLTL
ncbi:phosphoglycolate phosphatase [Alteromonas sp. KC3]|uniref:phosphoglycolate phosphatase n=1 Tax=unclassified Alteromonas TaxID=2614992 RepID=UPI0019204EB7|nr:MULTISPECIES: phosphoglycolate phosphatase [unclassified Alteromonas]BCO18999.1 phosphoglycolate phosphatase [Alteromonas sp. KC3]BCO22957.1 phosphoglycolate phosphatase [Alteromonas sp. KC14]